MGKKSRPRTSSPHNAHDDTPIALVSSTPPLPPPSSSATKAQRRETHNLDSSITQNNTTTNDTIDQTPLDRTGTTFVREAERESSSAVATTNQTPTNGGSEVDDDEEDEQHRHWDNFVEEYHDTVIELPLEFQRTFTLVRELEDSQQAATHAFKAQLLNYLHSIPKSVRESGTTSTSKQGGLVEGKADANTKVLLNQITKAARATIRAAEDKINLAQTLYDSVDRHIQRLDNDLARHEDSLVIGMRPGTLPSHDAPSASQKEAPGATTSRGAIALGEKEAYEGVGGDEEETSWNRRGRGGADGRPMVGTEKYMQEERKRARDEKLRLREEKRGDLLNMGHIDPNEPTYCFCERVSFGQMVGCENDDCAREWFHFECVGLEAPPIGEWYCSECAEKLGKNVKKKGRWFKDGDPK